MSLKRRLNRVQAREAVRRISRGGGGDPALNLARSAYQRAEVAEAKADALAKKLAQMFPDAFGVRTDSGLWTPPNAEKGGQ